MNSDRLSVIGVLAAKIMVSAGLVGVAVAAPHAARANCYDGCNDTMCTRVDERPNYHGWQGCEKLTYACKLSGGSCCLGTGCGSGGGGGSISA